MLEDSTNYKHILEQISDGVYVVDLKRKITFWNHAAEKITGYNADEVVGKFCADNILMHVNDEGDSLCKGACPILFSLEKARSHEELLYLRHKAGHRIPVKIRISPIYEGKKIVGAVEVFSDATEQSQLARKIQHLEKLAMVDDLTGIPNRRFLEQSLDARSNELTRYDWPYGVVIIDIDYFKQVNDTHGHQIGDEVLKMVAKTLAHNARVFDIVGRWGGEEFLAILPHVSLEQLNQIGDRYRRLVNSAECKSEKGPISVTVSIGAALANKDEDLEKLIERADKCLYNAKRYGRNRIETSEYERIKISKDQDKDKITAKIRRI